MHGRSFQSTKTLTCNSESGKDNRKALTRKVLLGSAKELEKKTLLYILVFINTRSNGASQSFVNIGFRSEFLDGCNPFLPETDGSLRRFVMKSGVVQTTEMDHINMGSINGFHRTLLGIWSNRNRSVDTWNPNENLSLVITKVNSTIS